MTTTTLRRPLPAAPAPGWLAGLLRGRGDDAAWARP